VTVEIEGQGHWGTRCWSDGNIGRGSASWSTVPDIVALIPPPQQVVGRVFQAFRRLQAAVVPA
jgi:hypothetical protein